MHFLTLLSIVLFPLAFANEIDRKLQDVIPDENASAIPTPTPLVVTVSDASIGDYHVILWTSIVLGAILLGTIYFMLGMEGKRDAQLEVQLVTESSSSTSR